VAGSFPLTDLAKLVRAYGVLAGTLDTVRVIAGPLSRRWIAAETERLVPLASLPASLFRTRRGRELLAAELFPDQDVDPERLDPDRLGPIDGTLLINTNRLPKLEPLVNRAVLAANLLLGVRLYGRRGQGMPSVSHDLIVAAMLQDTLGRPYRDGPTDADEQVIVDDAYLSTWFDEAVAGHARRLAEAIGQLEAAVQHRRAPPPIASPEIATAVAAIMAARLCLSARAAGDQAIGLLDPSLRAELETAGVDGETDFPERPILAHDHACTVAAFDLDGVDHLALREPLRDTLVMAVGDALDDPAKRTRLSGRRGRATDDVHLHLPVMRHFVVTEAPDSIEAVHIASLELVRSLEAGRRKSLSTMSAHAFRIAALAERVLGHALEPIVVTLALLHDVVEDGALEVTGFDHSLNQIQHRFGGPIAAMVSELTDSNEHDAGASKAALTLEHPHLLLPRAQYDVDRFTRMELAPTGRAEPYTLTGIVIKLIDTVVSLEEGLRDPDLMNGHWRHSGARIYWAQRVRGAIVAPLIERLRIEIADSRRDPLYHARPHHVNAGRLRAGLALVEMTLAYQDLYATQNLAILAREYGLRMDERERLMAAFDDPDLDEVRFRNEILGELLDDRRLLAACREGRLPDPGHSALYPKGSLPGAARDESTCLAYRRSALHRQDIRRELALDSDSKRRALALRRQRLLRVFDATMSRLDVAPDTSR